MTKYLNRSLGQETSIYVHRLEKCYRNYGSSIERLHEIFWKNKRTDLDVTWALRPLSLKVRKGETIGIIGKNGSGKSTLLKMICGVLKPSGGSVQIEGRLGALLELGSGFNPEFTGLENIYLNGSILGLSQQKIKQKLESILSFADIGKFIESPLRTYSSGMALRLAFAVQACIDPDILVIDEALAVGDEAFQKKCFNRLRELKEKGTSILFVTHSCPSIIQHCDRALLLDQGYARWLGRPDVTTTLYQRLHMSHEKNWNSDLIQYGLKLTRSRQQEQRLQPDATSKNETSHGFMDPSLESESKQIYPNQGIRIENITILNQNGQAINTLTVNTPFSLVFDYYSEQPFKDLQMMCHIANPNGARITGQAFPSLQGLWAATKEGESFSIRFHFHGGLLPGLYFIGGGVVSPRVSTFLHRVIDFKALRILDRQNGQSFGLCDLSAARAEFIASENPDQGPSSL
ncbi:MAG: ABC transporter ATP-binding protein [Cyanobacteriota bacterium]|nr:ABC transporter ATP-binding protein [Cyanobacteriota bacterium]